ncbi:MAG TPA: GNAT family N-acetyltransferase [Thermomicrobiales bacterium]|nr:GNAT family N-acetyltransferase [Thermomicrobiales bacterium]
MDDRSADTSTPTSLGTLLIRPAVPGDREAIVVLGASDQDAAQLAPASVVADCLDAGCSFVALMEGTLIGYLLDQPIAYDGVRPLTLWVEALVIHPDYRRRGVATALYHALGAWAETRQVKGILARVTPDEAAAWALHRRAGFEPDRDDLVFWRISAG